MGTGEASGDSTTSPRPVRPEILECIKSAFVSSLSAEQVVSADSVGSKVVIDLVALADRIYVLCVKCPKLRVPEAWAAKLTLVRGRMADKCTKNIWVGKHDHYARATKAHKLIVEAASLEQYQRVAVIEEDFRIFSDYSWSSSDLEALTAFVQADAWETVRLGYYTFVKDILKIDGNKQTTCSPHCWCRLERSSEHLCHLAAGCGLVRSSMAYL